ncbi:TPA: vWA domain-containing protein, partial [Photobacterium damselae]
MADFTFIHPMWLIAIVPLLLLLPWLKSKSQSSSLIAPHIAVKLGLSQPQHKTWPLYLLGLAWILAVIALAGPSWEKTKLPAYSLSGARVLVMDMSKSMYATDIAPNRLTQARFKALDMLPGWKEGSTGLVTYAGDGYTISPLTDDSSTLANLIPSLSPKIMPIPGSNAASGIRQAIDLLKQAGDTNGDIILITDGMTEKESQESLAELKNTHYRVSILAVGTEQGAPIEMPDGRLLTQNGQTVIAKVDPNTLSAITSKTGGLLQFSQADNQGVNNIVKFTAKPRNQLEQGKQKELEERLNNGFWLLLPLILLALLGFRRGIVLAALMVFMPLDYAHASPWKNQDQQGYDNYQQGQYTDAVKDFSSPAWKGIAQYKAGQFHQAIKTLEPLKDTTSRYNLGNAYAQSGQYEKAINTYEEVLKQEPTNTDAKKNLEVVKKALENQQNKQDQSKKQDKQQSQNQQNHSQKNQQKQDSNEQKENKNQNSQSSEQSQQEKG